MKWSTRRLYLICPNTGSVVVFLSAWSLRPWSLEMNEVTVFTEAGDHAVFHVTPG
jgi:hypothetical protein